MLFNDSTRAQLQAPKSDQQYQANRALQMQTFGTSVVINCSIEAVFAFVSPGDNWAQWATEPVEISKPSERPRRWASRVSWLKACRRAETPSLAQVKE